MRLDGHSSSEIRIPMRDGVCLAADVYWPRADGPVPAILERTPYDKREGPIHWTGSPQFFAERGYAVVIQDVRGRAGSDGVCYPMRDDGWGERRDGYDTIEWIARQPWCDGQVGMFGGSYAGATQLAAAAAAPPHLSAIVPRQAFASFSDFVFRGRAREHLQIGQWVIEQARMALAQADRRLADLQASGSDAATRRYASELCENPLQFIHDWLSHPADSEYWEDTAFPQRADRVTAPGLHIASWYDMLLAGSLRAFAACRASSPARQHQRLVIGPWLHTSRLHTDAWGRYVGDLDMGEDAKVDLNQLMLMWFDRWLRGLDNGIPESLPAVRYFMIGANEWRDADEWPPPGTRETFLHLDDDSLDWTAPERASQRTLHHDPAVIVTTHGGDGQAFEYPAGHDMNLDLTTAQRGPRDQREHERGGLCYTSALLVAPLEIVGPVGVRLRVRVDRPGGLVFARLSDVDPGGPSIGISDGAETLDDAPAGETTAVDIDLRDIAIRIPAGHALRLFVSTSYEPRFGRGSYTSESWQLTVETGSRMILRILENG